VYRGFESLLLRQVYLLEILYNNIFMSRARRNYIQEECYPVTIHRIPRRQVAHTSLAAQINELKAEPEFEQIELPSIEEGGGIPRDRKLTLIQEAAEGLVSYMTVLE
jgi:hypothetical protein